MTAHVIDKLSDQTHKCDEDHRKDAATFGERTEPRNQLDPHHQQEVNVGKFAEMVK